VSGTEVAEVAQPAADLAERLLETVPQATRRIRRAMRAHGAPGLTIAQLRALIFLRRRAGIGLSPLADHLGMSLPASSALIQRLVLAGLVDRTSDPSERRRIQLQLTDEGAERLARGRAGVRGWLAGELAGLSPADQATLSKALEILDRVGRGWDDLPRRVGE
jgi:DNA-binding MarR family transcriptional regulator